MVEKGTRIAESGGRVGCVYVVVDGVGKGSVVESGMVLVVVVVVLDARGGLRGVDVGNCDVIGLAMNSPKSSSFAVLFCWEMGCVKSMTVSNSERELRLSFEVFLAGVGIAEENAL